MNTYQKFAPNVFVAKCQEMHNRGDIITLETKWGDEHECKVWNLVAQANGFYFYSITRTDGTTHATRMEAKAERHERVGRRLTKASDEAYQKSHNATKHIPFGQPILVGHHSEAHHRRDINTAHNQMRKSVEAQREAEARESKAAYWRAKAAQINLSMPESLEYYEFALGEVKKYRDGLKDGSIPREHDYSLPYATKRVKELTKLLATAKVLWAEPD
jgi:hypothetical protein